MENEGNGIISFLDFLVEKASSGPESDRTLSEISFEQLIFNDGKNQQNTHTNTRQDKFRNIVAGKEWKSDDHNFAMSGRFL